MAQQDLSELKLWRKLLTSYKTLERNISSILQRYHKQSLSRYDVLHELHDHPEEWISVGELARKLMDEGSGTSTLLTRMEKENLITRRLNPNDRRSFQVALTDEGRRVHKYMASSYDAWAAEALKEFSVEERELLYGLLDRLKMVQEKEAARNKKA
jgi:DNA-binding MarR family transcriptional regulator